MKNLSFLFLFFIFIHSGVAENSILQSLKIKHNATIEANKDIKFTKGMHYIEVFDSIPTSTYILGNEKSSYSEYAGIQFYRVVGAQRTMQGIVFTFVDKIVEKRQIETLQYHIFHNLTSDKNSKLTTMIDYAGANLIRNIDWRRCIANYTTHFYKLIKKQEKRASIDKYLQYIGSSAQLYQCRESKNKALKEISINPLMKSKSMTFKWMGGTPDDLFLPHPTYQAFKYPVMGLDSTKITDVENAWGITIKTAILGENNSIVKIWLDNVSYKQYPVPWRSMIMGRLIVRMDDSEPPVHSEIYSEALYFNWRWNRVKQYPPQPVYKKMPYPILGNKMDIIKTYNITGMDIRVEVNGRNIKIWLAQCGYSQYKGWHAQIYGKLTCTMEKND